MDLKQEMFELDSTLGHIDVEVDKILQIKYALNMLVQSHFESNEVRSIEKPEYMEIRNQIMILDDLLEYVSRDLERASATVNLQKDYLWRELVTKDAHSKE
ncbi:hypothetical protein [Salicibibacter kimchii]|uniref:Uncharacterized protein n=1 Tax=Salicibibacter kimchii TaxID=2099786 RepID=A0A345C2I0_9BACI|nr:hypothetical protein [Salicibibacter kimchii]AXF57411.1 hypothetical protein DT065_16420 [Salicibibacter kimchii]